MVSIERLHLRGAAAAAARGKCRGDSSVSDTLYCCALSVLGITELTDTESAGLGAQFPLVVTVWNCGISQ